MQSYLRRLAVWMEKDGTFHRNLADIFGSRFSAENLIWIPILIPFIRPMMEINRPAGSLGRSQACNLALRTWGATNITDKVLTEWLERFVVRNEWLGMARKRPVPHESWFQVAGYFFYYGHYYAILCADALPKAESAIYRKQIPALLLPIQEKDGSWWDFPLYNYHQQYGTAFALMTLARCRDTAPR